MSEQETSSQDSGRTTPSEANGHGFAPPPEFQSSPLDRPTENQTAPNGLDLSMPQRDLFQPLPSTLEMATQRTIADSHSVSLNSQDFFKLASVEAEKSSNSAVPLKDGGVRSSNPFYAPPQTFADPFTSPSEEAGLFLSPQPVVTNPFRKPAASEVAIEQDPPIQDLFGSSLLTAEDAFSPLSVATPEPFPRTVTRDLLQDFSSSEEPLSNTPSSRYNPFTAVPNGDLDIFKPPSEDLPHPAPRRSRPTPTLSSPSESSNTDKPPMVVLATPQGSKHDILQATPFVQDRSSSASSEQSSPELARVRTLVGIGILALLLIPKITVFSCDC